VVSRAFQVLSDPDKKSRFDQFGGDPDNRFSSSGAGAASSPFAGFARSPGGRNPMFDAEISPEDLFNQFFGGGMGGGFAPFGRSPVPNRLHSQSIADHRQAAEWEALVLFSTWEEDLG
jgi:DnaJ-class molecular chaperone